MANEIDFGGKTLKNATLDAETIVGGGGGAGGLVDTDTYIFCKPGDSFSAKYDLAAELTPGGNEKSATNRAYLIVLPGTYSVITNTIGSNYVDIIGLGSNRLDRGCYCAVKLINLVGEQLTVSATNVRIKGIDIGSARLISGYSSDQYFEECRAGDWSFGRDVDAGWYANYPTHLTVSYGTYINCVGGHYSFGGGHWSPGWSNNQTEYYGAAGYYANCISGNFSFGGHEPGSTWSYWSPPYTVAFGTFINCEGGDYFAHAPWLSGLFVDCVGGSYSFGADIAAGNGATFRNCVGGGGSFAAGSDSYNFSGLCYSCIAGADSFRCWVFSGRIHYCIAESAPMFNGSGYNVDNNGNIANLIFSKLNAGV